jgi:hypothetical protein
MNAQAQLYLNKWVKVINKGDHQPTLSEAQDFIGGYVERTELPNGDLALVDEEGLLKDQDPNPVLFEYWGVFLVGKAIVIKADARNRKSANGWG